MDVVLHQGSALSSYLFVILVDVITEWARKELRESITFVDNTPICAGKEVGMTGYLDTWRTLLEERERGVVGEGYLSENTIYGFCFLTY